MRGLILANPDSGSSETDPSELQERFPGHGVETCQPEDLPERVRAARTVADFVGVAGGDGTLGTAAEQLVGTDTPLLAIPAGTRNHFARELGIHSLDVAARAAAAGVVRHVSVGRVNGRSFLNNSSIGLYSELVLRRERYERRAPKSVAVATGRLEASRLMIRQVMQAATVDASPRHLEVALDGELETLEAPLRYEVGGRLAVLVPPETAGHQ